MHTCGARYRQLRLAVRGGHFDLTHITSCSQRWISCSSRRAQGSARQSSAPPGSHGWDGDGSACASWRRCRATSSSTRPDCRARKTAPAPDRTRRCGSLCSPGCPKNNRRQVATVTVTGNHTAVASRVNKAEDIDRPRMSKHYPAKCFLWSGILAHINARFLGPPESTLQMACWSAEPLWYSSRLIVTLQRAWRCTPKIVPSIRGSVSQPNIGFLGPNWVYNPNGISIGSSVL